MKYISLALSSLALIGVIVLFATKPKDKKAQRTVVTTKDSTGKEVVVPVSRIAYVDMDTLEANYDLFKIKKGEFETRQKAIDAELAKLANDLQNDYNSFQQKMQSGKITSEQEAQNMQQSLMQRKEAIETKEQNLGNKYLKDQEAFNKQMHDDLLKFIEDYSSDKGYDYVLSYNKLGAILFTNKELDITQDVVEGMNSMKKAK